jgi:hypothetical protein
LDAGWEARKKGPLGRPVFTWVDNVNKDLTDTECGGTGWIDVAQDRNQWRALVNAVMNFRFP